MQTLKCYYLVDVVSEKIVGSFTAISEEVARRILAKVVSDNNFTGYSDCINVYKDSVSNFRMFETFKEVTESCIFFDFLIKPFEGINETSTEDSEDA